MKKDKKTVFTKLKEDDKLVDLLLSEIWWRELVNLSHTDSDINIQIRPDSINVYSKMGSLLRIGLQGGKICCEIHYKYLVGNIKPEYVKIYPDGNHLIIDDEAYTNKEYPNIRDILKNIKTVKQNIAVYAGEEKAIQSKLVEKNKETIVDVEVAFSGKYIPDSDEAENTRIDIVNYDKNKKKLVFIELKRIFDKRLYSNEINKQIKKYYDFAKNNEDHIIEAYQNVIRTKIKLGIIKNQSRLAKAEISAIERRPLLVIAGFNQCVIYGLSNKIREYLKESIYENRLAGLYFFGKDVDLNLQKAENKILY